MAGRQYIVRAQFHDGDALSEFVYGPFRSTETAERFRSEAQALADAVENTDGEGDMGHLHVEMLYLEKPSIKNFLSDYYLLGEA